MLGFPPSHQNKFPDIPDRFLKMPDGASSIYHWCGRLRLPHSDPLLSPFNVSITSFRHIHFLLYLSTWHLVVAFFISYNANGNSPQKILRQTAKFPEIPVKTEFPEIPWLSRKWEPWLSVAKYTLASDNVKIHRYFVLTYRMSSHSSLIRWSLWWYVAVEPTATAPDAEVDSGASCTDQTPVWDTSRQQETAVHWQCTPYSVDSLTQNLCLYSF